MNLTETAYHFVDVGTQFYTVIDCALMLKWTKLRHNKAKSEYGTISHFNDLKKVFIDLETNFYNIFTT